MKKIPLYPFTFVSFVVLAFVAANFRVDRLIGMRSLIILNIAVAIFYMAFRYFKLDRLTSAYYVFNLFFFLLFYGQFYFIIITEVEIINEATLHFIIPAIWIFLQLAAILGWHKASNRKLITEALNAACAVALFASFYRIGNVSYQENQYYNDYEGYKSEQFLIPVEEFELQGSKSPDIYYLILDGYGRKDVLSELYEYDNQPFIEYLSQRGFYIAEQSHSNYIQTPLSITSSLNMNYLFPQVEPRLLMLKQTNLLRDSIKRNIVFSSLKERGYTTIAFDSGFYHTVSPNVDKYITKYFEINVFEQLLAANTPLGIYTELFDNVPRFTFNTHRQRIEFGFEQFNDIPSMPGPKVVFMHLVIPHPPFVFDREGNPVQPRRAMELLDGSDFLGDIEEYQSGYVDQTIYLNEILKKTVDLILDQSETQPIIIIQGDHGPGSLTDWDSVESTCHWERNSILNAYFFPDQDYSDLANNTSPINTFRIIFNQFFETEFDILEDKTFYSTDRQLIGQVDVTAELTSRNNCSLP